MRLIQPLRPGAAEHGDRLLDTDITLRLVQPALLLGGVGLALMGVCALLVAGRFRIRHLFFAAICLFVSALPWLVVGGIDASIWIGLADTSVHPPDFLARIFGLRPYLLFLAACSIATATFGLLRRPA